MGPVDPASVESCAIAMGKTMRSVARHTVSHRIRLVGSADELDADWDELAARLDAPVFHTRAFMRAYEHHPVQKISDPHYLEVRGTDGLLRAAAPVYRQGDPLGLLGLAGEDQGLLSPMWHSPDSRVLSLDQDALDVLQRAFAALAQELGCPLWGFVNLSADSPIVSSLSRRGFQRKDLVPRWVLPREFAPDGPSYLTALSRPARHELRRQLRRAQEQGAHGVTHRATHPELVRLLQFVAATATRAGSPKYYDPEQLAAFLRELGDPVRVLEVRGGDGETLAVGICFVEATRLQYWAAGYVRDRPDLTFSPYYVLWWEVLDLMWALDVHTAECGRLNETFKRKMGLVPRDLVAMIGPPR